MRLAIADPPYLGRAHRWYGQGRGHSAGRGRADIHPEANRWDDPQAHVELLAHLRENYDGWAVSLPADCLPIYLAHAGPDVRVAAWTRPNAIPSGTRIRAVWEPVVVLVPPDRSAHGTGAACEDALTAGVPRGGWAGRKPAAWTHWILAMLGYDPHVDNVSDLFPGSGGVAEAVASYDPAPVLAGRTRWASPATAQRLHRTRRASDARRAAVLAALREGASVRAVASDAGVSTNTVQRWKREATQVHCPGGAEDEGE